MQQPQKSRLELLQEWKEQRAAKQATGAGGQLPGRPPSAPKPGPGAPAAAPRAARPGEKENAVDPRPQVPAQPSAASLPAAAKAAPWDQHSRRPALPAGQRAHMEAQFGALEGRLQALRRESVKPMPGGDGPCAAAPPPYPDPAAAASSPPMPAAGAGAAAAAAGPMQAHAPAGRPPPSGSSAAAAAAAALAEPGRDGGTGLLAARLDALKRESVRPSFAGPQPQFEAGGGLDLHTLSHLANQLFNDEQFLQLCDKGMSSQLTRSKDGATEETKIMELAGMVKLLRRGMKELQNRTQQFIDHAVTFEKEAAQEVESVKLSSESATRAMEAELAHARREAATVAAHHKNDLANWQGQLDFNKAEVVRLRREFERVEGERDQAREAAKKMEAQRLALEARLKDMEKAAGQQAKELQMDKNSAAQQIYELREAAERQRQQLSQSLQAAETTAGELRLVNEALQQQAAGLEESNAALSQQLQELGQQRDALQATCDKLSAELSTQQQQHEKVVADSACVLGELQEWQDKAAALVAELGREQAEREASQQRLEEALAAHAQDREQWALERSALEANQAAASQLERGLLEEKAQLKGGLTAALEQRAELDARLQQTAAELQQAAERLAACQAEQAALQAQVEQLGRQLAGTAQALEEEQEARAAAVREASERGNKLAQLEGELEALQECTIGLGAGDQREMLSRMVSKIAALEAAVAGAEAKRREIHNQLVELKGNIRVFCRIRPTPRSVVACLPDGVSVRLQLEGKDHPFSFDKVFGATSSQAEVFQEVSDLVQSALDGYKVCLFSYGQTGAGKTHTMQGSRSVEGQGIIPRSISKILETVAKLREQGWEYTLEASFIEVYNETLRDLLAACAGGKREAGKISESNAIQHQPNGGHTVVLGATRAAITCEEEADAICRKAAAARAVESTAMNAVSSRSHSVFMLYITGRNEASGTVLQGSLNLVDLAGSERLARSQAEGQRAKEACSINKSLSSLGDVFQALASKTPHIPYRNSKLTHLLQPCLGGPGKTLMVVNVSPDPDSAQETLCSLRFAAKVNSCETAAKGGATRNITMLEGGGRLSFDGRPSLAPTDPEARRMSLAGGGLKRKAPAPLPPPRTTRPKPN